MEHDEKARVVSKYTDSNWFYNAELTGEIAGYKVGVNRDGYGGNWSLKPSGHYMYRQFNIQQLYALPTLYLCVSYLSENKQRLVPLTA